MLACNFFMIIHFSHIYQFLLFNDKSINIIKKLLIYRIEKCFVYENFNHTENETCNCHILYDYSIVMFKWNCIIIFNNKNIIILAQKDKSNNLKVS